MRDPIWGSLSLLFFLAVAVIGGYAGRMTPVREQWPVFDGLRATAGVVFTVVGIWLAILYPEVLQRLTTWRQPERRQTPRVTRLFAPLVDSAVVVVVVSLFALVRPLFTRVSPPTHWIPIVRGLSFGLLVGLTLILVRALLRSILPLFELSRQLAAQEELARTRSRLPEPRSRSRESGGDRDPVEMAPPR